MNNRLNEDLHNRHLSHGIDYLILCERLHLAVIFLRNLHNIKTLKTLVKTLNYCYSQFQLYQWSLKGNYMTHQHSLQQLLCLKPVQRIVVDVTDANYLSISEDALLYFWELITYGKIYH